MTEFMKRYEEETCNTKCLGVREYYIGYMDWLEAQLRWRPVGEKPEKADMYFVECKPYTGCGSTLVTTAWFDGEKFPWHDVVK